MWGLTGWEEVREGGALKIMGLFLNKKLQSSSNWLKPREKLIESSAGEVLGVGQMLQTWLDLGVQMMSLGVSFFLILDLVLWLRPLSSQ